MDARTVKMLAERRQAAESAPPPARGVAFVSKAVSARLKAHWFLATTAAAALVAALSVAHYMLVSLPRMKREQIALSIQVEQQRQSENSAKQAGLEVCLSNAQADYVALWDGACKARNVGTGCALPTSVVDQHEQRRRDDRNKCLRQYSLDSR